MTDCELLELAAKAAGMPHTYNEFWRGFYIRNPDGSWVPNHHWNPLTDDGDALRLAVKLRLDIDFEKLYMVSVWCPPWDEWVTEYSDDGMGTDIAEKTRRAIVRAAARIGKEMK